jgi:hypothetical protein
MATINGIGRFVEKETNCYVGSTGFYTKRFRTYANT